MSALRRLWNVVRRSRLDDDLREELATHLALIEEEEQRRGSTPEQAREAARARFGNALAYRDRALDPLIARWLDDGSKDVRFALRQLRKAPAFAAVAVVSLAVGIGANAAIFTLADAVLLKPLPVRDPAGLVLPRRRARPWHRRRPDRIVRVVFQRPLPAAARHGDFRRTLRISKRTSRRRSGGAGSPAVLPTIDRAGVGQLFPGCSASNAAIGSH